MGRVLNSRDWIAGEHVLQRRGLCWPPGFFTGQAGCFCCASAGDVYHFGGTTSIGGVAAFTDNYDASGNSWTSKTAMTSARAYFGHGSVGTTAYVACGYNSTFTTQQTLYAYTPDSWSTKTSSPTPARATCAGDSDGTDLYIASGASGASIYKDLDKYSVAGDSWTSKTDTPTPARYQTSFSAIGSSYLYLMGGFSSGPTALVDNDRYDISGDSWTAKTDMTTPARALEHGRIRMNGYIYMCGGQDSLSYYGDNDRYSDDSWTAKANTAVNRVFSGCATRGTTAAYCIGGQYAANPARPDCEEYVEDTWTSKNSMANSLAFGGASTLV